MRTLDVRRHTMRRKPGSHLSRDGIALARLVANQARPYDLVVASTIPRAIETAIAMGYEVDQLADGLGQLPDDVTAEVDFPSPFARVSQAVATSGAAARFAAEISGFWRQVVEQLPDGGRALIVTHGLFIELGAVACLPGADHDGWGGPIGYCEGMRLQFDGGHWQNGQVLRVPEEFRLIEN
jgi:broad specificity phosphatase PhoE